MHRLAAALAREGVVSKYHVTASGRTLGGTPLGRGALFHLLRNRVYCGQIVHKLQAYTGEHEAIVDAGLFEQVQQQLAAAGPVRAASSERRTAPALLAGRLFDARGEAMSPAHSRGRSGRLYRYYVSASLQQGGQRQACLQRVAAPALEQLVSATLERLVPGQATSSLIQAVHLRPSGIDLVLPASMARGLAAQVTEPDRLAIRDQHCVITIPLALPLRGGHRSIKAGKLNGTDPDPKLIAALRRAHAMVDRDVRGQPVITAAPALPYERRLLRLAFLAPDIQKAILAGRQPRRLNLEALVQSDLPLTWSAQRIALGFSPAPFPVMRD